MKLYILRRAKPDEHRIKAALIIADSPADAHMVMAYDACRWTAKPQLIRNGGCRERCYMGDGDGCRRKCASHDVLAWLDKPGSTCTFMGEARPRSVRGVVEAW